MTLWTIAYQVPLSIRFSRQEYWSGFPFLSPGDLPGPRIEPRSQTLQADSLPSEPPEKHAVMPKTQSLCTGAKLNLTGGVLGEGVKSSFIVCSAKGDTVDLCPQTLCVPACRI